MILAGCGFRAGGQIKGGSIVDLAPTLCHLLGIEGGRFQGRVLEEALT
jgi:hypothetical protein